MIVGVMNELTFEKDVVGVMDELTFEEDEDGDDDYEFYGVLERAVDVAAEVGNEEE